MRSPCPKPLSFCARQKVCRTSATDATSFTPSQERSTHERALGREAEWPQGFDTRAVVLPRVQNLFHARHFLFNHPSVGGGMGYL